MATGTGTTGTTGSSGGVYNGNTPGSGTSGAYGAQQLLAYQNALTQLQNQRNQWVLQSGVNTDGSVIDGANGQYQQMMRGLAGQLAQAHADQNASGFLGSSGLSRQAMEATQRLAGQTTAQFGLGVNDELAGINQGVLQANIDYNMNPAQNQLAAIQQAIAAGNFNPADVGNLGVPYGQGGTPVTTGGGTTSLPPGIFTGWKPPKPKGGRHR
jgi:hypothetical protein